MDRIAHIHLEGPLINAAKALMPEKPVSLGWNPQLKEERWAFVFKEVPSVRVLNAAEKTGFVFESKKDFSVISLPGVKENEVKVATVRFDALAEEYKGVTKKTASVITRFINEDAPVVRKIATKSRRKIISTADFIRRVGMSLLYIKE